MAQTIIITVNTIGPGTGPFNIYSLDNLGVVTGPFETGVTRAQLLAGFVSINVPNDAVTIRVVSTAADCTISLDIFLNIITTTTTTTINPSQCVISGTAVQIAPSGCQCYNVLFSELVFPVVPLTYIPCTGGNAITTTTPGKYCINTIIDLGTAVVTPITTILNCATDADCTITTTTTTVPVQRLLNPSCYTINYDIPMPGNSFVANGVTVTVSSTDPSNLCPAQNSPNYRGCMPEWNDTSIALGGPYPTISTTCDVTLTFSQPVNNVKILLYNYSATYMTSQWTHPSHPYPHMENQEEFTFTVDSGIVPTINPCDYCNAILSGNKITGLIDLPNGIDISNGCGIFEINHTVPYTSLRIDGVLYGFNCTQQSGLATSVQLGDFTII